MRIKTYVFDDMKKGIEVLKKEYGPDTIIVDVKENIKGAGDSKLCEISVAIKEDSEKNNHISNTTVKIRENAWSNLVSSTIEKISQLQSELSKDRLKMYPLALKSLYEKMCKNGFDRSLAMEIISEIYNEIGELSEQTSKATYFLKEILFRKLKVWNISDIDSHIIMVGPSGSGKTQTAKKLGVMLSALGTPVSVVLYKSKESNVSEVGRDTTRGVIAVDKREMLYHMIEKDRTKKIIDIPGRVEIQSEVLDRIDDAKSIIVFSAGSRDEKIKRYIDIYDSKRTIGLIFTNLDEEETLGHILSNLILFDQKICCFTTGQGLTDLVMPGKELFYKILFEGNRWIKEEKR